MSHYFYDMPCKFVIQLESQTFLHNAKEYWNIIPFMNDTVNELNLNRKAFVWHLPNAG